MTLNAAKCSRVPFRPAMVFDRGAPCSRSGGDPVRDGPPADLRCGIQILHGTVQSAENSQHITTGTRCRTSCTGFCSTARHTLRWPRLAVARPPDRRHAGRRRLELLENSNWTIERYRTGTISLELFWRYHRQFGIRYALHVLGFFAARKLPVAATVALGLVFEAVMLLHIRDNLTLTSLMLIHPC